MIFLGKVEMRREYSTCIILKIGALPQLCLLVSVLKPVIVKSTLSDRDVLLLLRTLGIVVVHLLEIAGDYLIRCEILRFFIFLSKLFIVYKRLPSPAWVHSKHAVEVI